MVDLKDKANVRSEAIGKALAELERLLIEHVKPGVFGKVHLEAVIKDGKLDWAQSGFEKSIKLTA